MSTDPFLSMLGGPLTLPPANLSPPRRASCAPLQVPPRSPCPLYLSAVFGGARRARLLKLGSSCVGLRPIYS